MFIDVSMIVVRMFWAEHTDVTLVVNIFAASEVGVVLSR
jgi:hypothetical protein